MHILITHSDKVGALVSMGLCFSEATHLHVVLSQEYVSRTLFLWQVDTNLHKYNVMYTDTYSTHTLS